MYKALVTTENYGQDYTENIAHALKKGVECVWKPLPKGYSDAEGLIAFADGYDAVMAGGEYWSGEAISRLAAGKLKVISRMGIGYDKIDLAAADKAGVYVTNTPGSFSNAVAEGALMLILAAVKRTIKYDSEVRAGIWEPLLGNEIEGMTIGFMAFGAIAQRLAEMLAPLHATLIAYDVNTDEALAQRYGVEFVNMDELLKRSDVISIHMPLNDCTREMINGDCFAKMKDGVVIINTARGGIIDEDALISALKTGKVGAAGLDVFAQEPTAPDNQLLKAKNAVLYPHATSLSRQAFGVTFDMAVDNIIAALSGGPVQHMVNHIG